MTAGATSFTVNGRAVAVRGQPTHPVLYALREALDLKGVRFGCGEGQCGACMIWVDGQPATACLTPLEAVEGRNLTTIEGLPDADAGGRALVEAVLDLAAGQCGYCLAGILMTAAALIRDEPDANRRRIAQALDGHLCRCGSHTRILAAVMCAAARP